MMENLDDLFAGAKKNAMQPSPELMARVLADATEVQPKARPLRGATAHKPARAGFLSGLAAVFGGAGALAGVGSAAIAGLLIGFVQPAGFSSMTGLMASTTIDQVELIPDIDALLVGE